MLDHGTPEHAADDPVEALRHRMRHSAAHVMADPSAYGCHYGPRTVN